MNIQFVDIIFEALEEGALNSVLNFNALFITPSAFEQASQDEYIEICRNSTIPSYFMKLLLKSLVQVQCYLVL